MNARLLSACLSLAVAALFACGSKKPPDVPPPVAVEPVDAGADVAEPAPPVLFERLGGSEGVTQIVEKLVENVTQDPAVSKAFKGAKGPKLDAFKKSIFEQLCDLTGGPCHYTGKDMKTAHKGMKITDAQFDSFVMDLKLAMGELKVPDPEQEELIAKLQPMKDDIVEVKSKPAAKK